MHILKKQLENRNNIGHRQFIAIVLLVLASCANPVAPTGGPRDTEPPLVVRTEPEIGSVNFNATEIRIWFNEFIQLKGLQQQFLSSPPFEKIPEIRIKGKSLVILMEEELRPNTTYTLFFGDAISDFNEGNPISNYRYFFSTGPVLDSMELAGTVLNAFTLKPERDVFVMLYDNYHDSVPYQERPYYISRTNKDGLFQFTNLRNIPYKLFALRDVNANLIYDMPNEEIAFADSLINPIAPLRIFENDSIQEGDSIAEGDIKNKSHLEKNTEKHKHNNNQVFHQELTTEGDSAMQIKKHQALTLYLFNEIDSTQRIEKAEFLYPNRLMFVFRFPVQNLNIKPIPEFEHDWKISELNNRKDTLWYWLRNIASDSIMLEVSAAKMETDTLRLSLVQLPAHRKVKQNDTIITRIGVKSNIPRSGPFDIHKPIRLWFSEPLASIDLNQIELLEDSVRVEAEIRFEDDVQRAIILNYQWKDTLNYALTIFDSVLCGIYGHYNDTLRQGFKTRAKSDYGNLKINLKHNLSKGVFIVYLLDEKDLVLQQKTIGPDENQVGFSFLLPGKYRLKLIQDANANGQWDTGIYQKGKHPERVYLFEKTLDLRANWDIEETFSVQEN